MLTKVDYTQTRRERETDRQTDEPEYIISHKADTYNKYADL